jgi:hypothetical protein
MYIGKISVALAIGLGLMTCAHAKGLCEKGEEMIFNCKLPKSDSSLCRSDSGDVLTYRNGRKRKINLEISDAGEAMGRIFYFSNTPYAGGGETHIRFTSSNYTYFIYNKTITTDDGPVFSAGVVIYQGGDQISNLVCSNNASIREDAYRAITREAYRSVGAK